MGRIEYFEHAHKHCYRKEIDGLPPVEVSVKDSLVLYSNKPTPRQGRRWKGTHLLMLGEEELRVEESLLGDYGPKLGIAVTYRKDPVTPEQMQANYERITQMARQLIQEGRLYERKDTYEADHYKDKAVEAG